MHFKWFILTQRIRAITSLTVLGGQGLNFPHFSSNFPYFFTNFPHFCPHFGPRVAHPGKPWLHHCRECKILSLSISRVLLTCKHTTWHSKRGGLSLPIIIPAQPETCYSLYDDYMGKNHKVQTLQVVEPPLSFSAS